MANTDKVETSILTVPLGFGAAILMGLYNEQIDLIDCLRNCDSWVLKVEKLLTYVVFIMGAMNVGQLVFHNLKTLYAWVWVTVLKLPLPLNDDFQEIRPFIELFLSVRGFGRVEDLWEWVRDTSLCLRMNNCEHQFLQEINDLKVQVCGLDPPNDPEDRYLSTCEQVFNDSPLILLALSFVPALFIPFHKWAFENAAASDDGASGGNGTTPDPSATPSNPPAASSSSNDDPKNPSNSNTTGTPPPSTNNTSSSSSSKDDPKNQPTSNPTDPPPPSTKNTSSSSSSKDDPKNQPASNPTDPHPPSTNNTSSSTDPSPRPSAPASSPRPTSWICPSCNIEYQVVEPRPMALPCRDCALKYRNTGIKNKTRQEVIDARVANDVKEFMARAKQALCSKCKALLFRK